MRRSKDNECAIRADAVQSSRAINLHLATLVHDDIDNAEKGAV